MIHDFAFNLHLARRVIEATPEAELDLETFKTINVCGTLHCAAGHLCNHPHFAQFMRLVPDEENERCSSTANWAWSLHPADPADKNPFFDFLDDHFGPDAFEVLFAQRGYGDLDHKHPDNVKGKYGAVLPRSVTDKALALWRIDQQLKRVEAA